MKGCVQTKETSIRKLIKKKIGTYNLLGFVYVL